MIRSSEQAEAVQPNVRDSWGSNLQCLICPPASRIVSVMPFPTSLLERSFEKYWHEWQNFQEGNGAKYRKIREEERERDQ